MNLEYSRNIKASVAEIECEKVLWEVKEVGSLIHKGQCRVYLKFFLKWDWNILSSQGTLSKFLKDCVLFEE